MTFSYNNNNNNSSEVDVVLCIIYRYYLQQFPTSATTLHFEYYEEVDETKAEKKVGLLCVLEQ